MFCIRTSTLLFQVEFRAILDFNVTCRELSFLFVNHTGETCNKKNRCQAEEIIQPSDITSCLVKKYTYLEIDIILSI